MAHVHHFSYGPLTPVLAYIMSFSGSLLGLLCTARARALDGRARAVWLTYAALAIGGTGIWVMHFIAMLGFTVPQAQLRYNVPITLLSAVVAVLVVGVGLFAVGFAGARPIALVVGGTITGLGVASMHYIGMAALRLSGDIGYSPGIVALSIVIAVVAATAALWFTLMVRGMWATVGAAAIMGVAVCGMHYTAMAAMRVEVREESGSPPGAEAVDFLMPLIVGISLVALCLLAIVAMSPTEDEIRAETELEERLRHRREAAPPPAIPAAPSTPTAGRWFGGNDSQHGS